MQFDEQTATHAHQLTARRDLTLLRSGLHMRLAPLEQSEDGRMIPLVFTNLAGHDYPTGTHRRGLRIEVAFDDQPPQVAAILAPYGPGAAEPDIASALGPGEERTITFPVPDHAAHVRLEVIYMRNRFDADALEVTIMRMVQALPASARPATR